MARLRLIAGPNGAGKSTFTTKILTKHIDLGTYINPDEIATTVVHDGQLTIHRDNPVTQLSWYKTYLLHKF